MHLACPKCKERLTERDGRAVCSQSHSFDKSKKGYYNLLLTSKGGAHGDNRKMLDCRREFLDSGEYRPLADALAECVARYSRGGALLDIGCGEGYYTERLLYALRERGCGELVAFDISKDAAALAKRRVKDAEVAVASAYDMPLADSTFDIAVNVFSPLCESEIHRVLSDEGRFIFVIPDKRHLFELKSLVYDTPYENVVKDTHLDGFTLEEALPVSFKMQLDTKEKISALFGMTPYAYRTSREGRERVEKAERLTVSAEFIIFIYKKV